MEINLNSNTIIDELMAVSALRARSAGGRGASRSLLTADQLPALRGIVRMAFAELCMRLGSAVEASDMDFEDPRPDEPYSAASAMRLSLTLSGGTPKGRELAVKRSLEHAVAMLSAAFALGDSADGSAAELRAEAAGAVDALRGVCAAGEAGGVGAPSRVVPFFF